MGKKSPQAIMGATPKKKCCRSKTRCMKCPVVISRLHKCDAHTLDKKQFAKALKKARAWA